MGYFRLIIALSVLVVAGCSFKASESQQQAPAVFVDNLRVAYFSPQRTVNEHLSLTNHYAYHFRFKPQFNPDAALSRSNQPITLPPGTRVRVRALLLHPEAQTSVELAATGAPLPSMLSFPWLAGFDDVVTIPDSGYVDVPVSLPIRYYFRPQLSSRTSLLVEITPERSSVPVAATVLQGNFRVVAPPNETSETLLFRTPENVNLDAFIQRIPHQEGKCISLHSSPSARCLSAGPQWAQSPLQLFVEYWERARPLRRITLDSSLDTSWEQADKPLTDQLAPLLNGGSYPAKADESLNRWLAELCAHAPAVMRAECASHPRVYFRVDRVTLMDSMESTRVDAELKTFPLEVSANFFREQMVSAKATEGDRSSNERSSGLYSKFAYEVYGSGGGYTRSVTWKDESYSTDEFSIQSDLRTRLQYQERFQFMVEQQKLPLVGRGRLCLLARVLPAGRPGEDSIPNFLVCGQPVRLQTIESFYYAWDQSPHLAGNVTDSREANLKGWSKLIRGTEAFQQFKNTITDKVRLLVFRKIEPLRDGGNRIISNAFYSPQGWQYRGDGGELPGVLQNIQVTPYQWEPSRLDQVVHSCAGQEPAATAELNSPEWRKWQRRYQYCNCFYDAAARQWTHTQFQKDYKTLEKTLEKSVHESCAEWAKGMWQ